MERTTTRLRRTFRYPGDDEEDDSLPLDLDEQEQETLIQTLQQRNASQNQLYIYALLAVSLICTIPYIQTLFNPALALLSLLSITSLLSTAFLAYILPLQVTTFSIFDNIHRPPLTTATKYHPAWNFEKGPLLTYLPYLNLGLSAVLILLGWVIGRKGIHVWAGFTWLPALNYGVLLLAKVVMGSVDPERELGALKYEFKGA